MTKGYKNNFDLTYEETVIEGYTNEIYFKYSKLQVCGEDGWDLNSALQQIKNVYEEKRKYIIYMYAILVS